MHEHIYVKIGHTPKHKHQTSFDMIVRHNGMCSSKTLMRCFGVCASVNLCVAITYKHPIPGILLSKGYYIRAADNTLIHSEQFASSKCNESFTRCSRLYWNPIKPPRTPRGEITMAIFNLWGNKYSMMMKAFKLKSMFTHLEATFHSNRIYPT